MERLSQKIGNLFKKDFVWLILLFLLVSWQTRFLFVRGLYTFSDEPHLANLYEMIRGFQGIQLPPRWAPDMSFNYGYPLFNFYYPLPFYLGSLFFLAFKLSLINSLKSVFYLGVLFSGISFYFFTKKFFSKLTAFSASVIYLFTPYRAVDLYVRGAVGELWSFVFLPLVLLFFGNLLEKKTGRNLALAAASLTGLILSHNLTAIVFLPILVVFCLGFSFLKEKSIKNIFWTLWAFLLGLFSSSFYWLPAIFEKKFIQLGTPFNPFDHFPFIKQLILPSWGYGASVWGPNDEMSFQIGVVNLLIVILLLFVFVVFHKDWKREKRFLFLFMFILFCLCIFLMNIRSWFLWKLLPLGDYLQFPWRLLMLTTFSTAFLVGFLEDLITRGLNKFLPFILGLLAIVLTLNYFRPAKIMRVDDNYYLNRFFIDRAIEGRRETLSQDYLNYSEDYLPLTIWTEQRPKAVPAQKIEVTKGVVEFREILPTKFTAEVKSAEPTKIFFHNYYFPGWKVWLDERRAEIKINRPLGEIELIVPAGDHQLLFLFTETPIRIISDCLSLVSIMVLGFLFLRKRFLC